jgi:predicted double-glycine peptidase
VTLAYAVQFEEITQTADLAVRGKGVESQINETFNMTVENNSMEALNTVTELDTVGNDNSSVPAEATGADTQIYDTTESVDMQLLDLNDSLDNYTVNVTVPQIDTSGIVMQSTDYSCGPAALATVLQNMGINTTEEKLMILAGTDGNGTSMYGLARAAQAKGVSATGMRLSVDDLRTNHIVHVILDGEGHYSVVREITETSVYLTDPSKGNIVLSREEFSAIFTGNVLVISGLLNQTETTNQTNITAPVSVQPENSQTLAAEEMQTVRGRGGRNRVVRRRWGFRVYLCDINTRSIVNAKGGTAGVLRIAAGILWKTGAPAAVLGIAGGALAISGHVLDQVNIHNTGVRVWVTWTGHVLWIAAQRR